MMTDPIADMLTRIRNAVRVERPDVAHAVASKVKRGLAEVLKREGYIWDWQEVEVDGEPVKPALRLELKYGPNGERVIQNGFAASASLAGAIYQQGEGTAAPSSTDLGITIISTSSWRGQRPRGAAAARRRRSAVRSSGERQRLTGRRRAAPRDTEETTRADRCQPIAGSP